MEESHLGRTSAGAREGFVLPSVISAVAIMSVIVVASLSTSTDERLASRAVRESTLASYAAEAGLRQTYGAWPTSGVNAMNPGDSLDLGWQSLPNKTAYRPVIHRVDNGGLQVYNVVVQGRRTGVNGGVSTIMGVVGGVPLFTRAVYGDTLIYLAGGGVIDGFDSGIASYNAATADSTADIATNGDLYVSKTTVKGNAGAGGAITYGNQGVITGAASSGAAAVPPYDIVPCPPSFSPLTPELQTPGVSYNPLSGVLSVSGNNAVLALTQSTYFFRSVVLTGNATLTVPGNPHVNVFIQDSIQAAGGFIANSGMKPTDLSLTACGTPSNTGKGNYWSIAGGVQAYFSVYAPNHVVYGVGQGDFYGAIVSSQFYASGGAKVHYDAALARAASTKLVVSRASWTELPGN
ncbi:MAG: DUF7305 domain-containing protein [Gemmatimonadaceae bacterium]